MADSIRFLSIDDVLRLHALAIEDQGGDPSLRDRGLLESAIAMPRQQFSEQYVHEDIPSMAAAYAFHICKNHPFVDGNKRAGTAAMIAFLSDNAWAFDATTDEAEPVILRLAASEIDKDKWMQWVRKYVHKKPSMELRDFFMTLSWDQLASAGHSFHEDQGSTPQELIGSLSEAELSIPALVSVYAGVSEFEAESENWIKAVSILKTLLAIHRIAEDMGYEW